MKYTVNEYYLHLHADYSKAKMAAFKRSLICIEAVKQTYGVTWAQLKSPDRTAKVSAARHAAIWLIKKETTLGWVEIAEIFKRRRHLAQYAFKMFENAIDHRIIDERENVLFAFAELTGESIPI